MTREEVDRLEQTTEQRVDGEPLAYVLGRKEFWSMQFAVTKDTLIPRSDSEVLIETLLEQYDKQTPLRILDIGTGSGCLLLSALSEFPQAIGIGVDISEPALAVAGRNAQSNDLAVRAKFLRRDLKALPQLDESDDELYQLFDVILCNPPYIPRQELHLVAPDVFEHEPHLALFSGGGPEGCDDEVDPEGLRMYQWLNQSVGKLFKASPATICLLMEVGSESQARAVEEIFNGTSRLIFGRFLFDASGKYRGLLFIER